MTKDTTPLLHSEGQVGASLPDNAFRELREGEQYEPLMQGDREYPEVNAWSVSWGLIMAVVFSAAAAYLGLKVGQVFEAAIPIAIIAVGLSTAARRKGALGENVIIQSIGASSGVIVAGAIFTLPALYILQAKYPEITVNFMQVFLSSLLGGCLGILFLIPFRRYFVKDMHGKYPFPEATATTQVLVSGQRPLSDSPRGGENSMSSGKVYERSNGKEALPPTGGAGSGASTLFLAAAIGGLYDFVVSTFGWWHETLTTRMTAWGEDLVQRVKLTFSINTGAAMLGLGYIVGLKYAAIICAGSLFVWWFLIPLLGMTTDGSVMLSQMDPQLIFKDYARYIGIGAIAMAGVIGIVKSWGVIKGAVGLAGRELRGKGKDVAAATLRTDRDLSMRFLAIAVVVALAIIFVFFYVGVIHSFLQALVAWLVVTVIAFLFTTVAANAIAIVGSNPVSGMTLMTLIIASLILVAVGLQGTSGMVASMIIGGVVCTALSMAGGFITDLKIGYWLGTTPAKQETWKFLGVLVSAATVGGVIIILNKTYGFTGEHAMVAPQANAMAAVIEPLMMGQGAPWTLYGVGALLALLLNILDVPVLAFALGMFIPLELNVPLVVGGAINWYVTTRSKDAALNKARGDRGTLLASGFIAGGALMGVVSALLRFLGVDLFNADWLANPLSEVCSIIAYILLIVYVTVASMKASKK